MRLLHRQDLLQLREDGFDLVPFVPQLLIVGDDVPHMHIGRGEDVHLFGLRLVIHRIHIGHRSQLHLVFGQIRDMHILRIPGLLLLLQMQHVLHVVQDGDHVELPDDLRAGPQLRVVDHDQGRHMHGDGDAVAHLHPLYEHRDADDLRVGAFVFREHVFVEFGLRHLHGRIRLFEGSVPYGHGDGVVRFDDVGQCDHIHRIRNGLDLQRVVFPVQDRVHVHGHAELRCRERIGRAVRSDRDDEDRELFGVRVEHVHHII